MKGVQPDSHITNNIGNNNEHTNNDKWPNTNTIEIGHFLKSDMVVS